MRFVPSNCIREGMIAAKPLYGKNGELFLNSGVKIRYSYIEKIKDLGYNGIYIEDDFSKDIEITQHISDSLRFKAVKSIKDTFLVMEGKKDSTQNIKDVTDLVSNIVDDILLHKDLMINMIDLKVFDEYTFYHSVNVTVLSIITGVALGLNKTLLQNLGISAILHDLGKVFIQKELLNKTGKLTDEEFEALKAHAYIGYQYLKEKGQISASSYVGVLYHHERMDGSGYPSGVKGKQIPLFGRIIAVADVYDALISNRPYRAARLPSEAIEYIMGGGGTLFDHEVVGCFTRRVAPYPTGTCVYLSNDKTGIVAENYADCCTRPRIKIIMHGDKIVEPYYIDLRNEKSARDITILGIGEV